MGKLHNVTSAILPKVREYNLPYYKMVANLTFYAIIKGGIMSDYTHFAAYIFYSGCVESLSVGIKLYGRVQRWEYCEKQRYVLSD